MAAKLTTPPDGVVTVDTGDVGRVVAAGPSTVAGSVVVQIGLTSAAVGAAGDPAIWGAVEPAPKWSTTPVTTDATRINVAAAIANKAFPDGNLPDACWYLVDVTTAPTA